MTFPTHPQDLCSTGKAPSPKRQHRRGTNSKICQVAQPTLHVLLTKMIKFSTETQTRMAISRAAASLPVLCLVPTVLEPLAWAGGAGPAPSRAIPTPQHPAGPAGAGPRFSNTPAGCSQVPGPADIRREMVIFQGFS